MVWYLYDWWYSPERLYSEVNPTVFSKTYSFVSVLRIVARVSHFTYSEYDIQFVVIVHTLGLFQNIHSSMNTSGLAICTWDFV